MLTDPIADMLTRIRNANRAMHDTVEMPSSKVRVQIARVLVEERYIADYEIDDQGDAPSPTLRIRLRYDAERRRVITDLQRVSTPGRRVYTGREDIPRVLGGMGIAVVSTSQGVMTGHEARRRGVGGEVLCSVW